MKNYEIRLHGEIDPKWAEWFDGLQVEYPGNGETVLSGPVADQAALFGLLAKVRDLRLPLISVTEVTASRTSSVGVDHGREVGDND